MSTRPSGRLISTTSAHRPLAFGPDFHQPQNPSHTSTLAQRTSAEIPDHHHTPNLATVPCGDAARPRCRACRPLAAGGRPCRGRARPRPVSAATRRSALPCPGRAGYGRYRSARWGDTGTAGHDTAGRCRAASDAGDRAGRRSPAARARPDDRPYRWMPHSGDAIWTWQRCPASAHIGRGWSAVSVQASTR